MVGCRSASMDGYESWGRYPPAAHRAVIPVRWRSEPPDLASLEGTVLPFGCGRSYGDCCLNDGGTLLDISHLRRFIAFDGERGLLRCEAGATLADILELVVPRGWFPPVLPGTRWVTVGGAIANDIHGKNHHRAGTFGRYVSCFELLRSSGERLVCSPDQNADLFRATIGGLGLTGLILWAEVRLRRVPSLAIAMERVRFAHLDEFFALSSEDDDYEYTAAWIDCLARGPRLGRGLYLRGDHASAEAAGAAVARPDGRLGRLLRVPFDAPGALLNPLTVSAFNALYYRSQLSPRVRKVVPGETFFFPLDGVRGWNRLYGRRGFLQHQCVVPDGEGEATVRDVLERVGRYREASFLAVIKRFGDLPSPGMLSFPRPGVTLALDFPYRGTRTLEMLEELDRLVAGAGGAVYPAKDAHMSPESFRRYFPLWREFAEHVDPKFSSSFWRRVSGV